MYAERKAYTANKIKRLTGAMTVAPPPAVPGACVYITGSVARDEAFGLSDLDLFLIYTKETPTKMQEALLLAWLEGLRLEAEFRAFSRGGEFLAPHRFEEMLRQAGQAEDDWKNHLTARMLLLLNSVPLLNPAAHAECRQKILDFYWRDCPDEDQPYLPVFLINDIRRLWHTMCLNFESANPPKAIDTHLSTSPTERRVGNLKLRAARLFTCYTPIVGLLHASSKDGVTKARAAETLRRNPVERLQSIASDPKTGSARSTADKLLESYEQYLRFMEGAKGDVEKKVSNRSTWEGVKKASRTLGDQMAQLMEELGRNKLLYRYVIV